jgi:predicted TPR repeat methyltransferase
VDELGYNGFERLRRVFDRAFGGTDKVPSFALVIDAGCGTGLVGEQVSHMLWHVEEEGLVVFADA